MAKDKAPKTGRDGIDSWTSNGHGVIVIKKPDNTKISNEEFREFVDGKDKKKK